MSGAELAALKAQAKLHRCCAPRSWIHRSPSETSPAETECLFGQGFHIFKTQEGWGYGQALSPIDARVAGYIGWMRLDDLQADDDEAASHRISALKAPVFSKADIKSPMTAVLPLNALLRAKAKAGDFMQLRGGGYVHCKHIAATGEYGALDFVTAAQRHLGLPYIWAGVSTDGLDCSGLIQSSFRASGRECLRDAGQQETTVGEDVKEAEALRRGDLIFWAGHVGVMTDKDTLLHANAFHMCVAQEPLAAAIARIGPPRRIKRPS